MSSSYIAGGGRNLPQSSNGTISVNGLDRMSAKSAACSKRKRAALSQDPRRPMKWQTYLHKPVWSLLALLASVPASSVNRKSEAFLQILPTVLLSSMSVSITLIRSVSKYRYRKRIISAEVEDTNPPSGNDSPARSLTEAMRPCSFLR